MTKRAFGAFARNERDFYATPFEAVWPLLPHLNKGLRFAEPCAGDGALVRALESAGYVCTYSGDIATGQDALKLTPTDLNGADIIVTNPPFTRPTMHALIEHLSELAPTWLLIELDWFATIQSAPYMELCTDIVPIGRIRWMPGTKMTSYDNYVWARFDTNDAIHGPLSTVFHPRAVMTTDEKLQELTMELNRDLIRKAMPT